LIHSEPLQSADSPLDIYNKLSTADKEAVIQAYPYLKWQEGKAVSVPIMEVPAVALGRGVEIAKEKIQETIGNIPVVGQVAKIVAGAGTTIAAGAITMLVLLPAQAGEEIAMGMHEQDPTRLPKFVGNTAVGMYEFAEQAAVKTFTKGDPWAMGELAGIIVPIGLLGIKSAPRIKIATDALYTKALSIPVVGKPIAAIAATGRIIIEPAVKPIGIAIELARLQTRAIKAEIALELARISSEIGKSEITQALRLINNSVAEAKIRALQTKMEATRAIKEALKIEYAPEIEALNNAYRIAKTHLQDAVKIYNAEKARLKNAITAGNRALAAELRPSTSICASRLLRP
jgi:hypothetical protein